MKAIVKWSLILILFVAISAAQDTLHIWEGMDKPFYKANDLVETESESWGVMVRYKITEPTLTIYAARGENSGKAVVICPGGGYSAVAIYHEGHDLASELADNGITAAVLKYRLPDPKSSDAPQEVPLADARRALQIMRERAGTYGFDKQQVGIMGFSAGSHLATVASLWPADDPDVRPDFSGLIYGVTLPTAVNTKWLETSLYYREMTPAEKAQQDLVKLAGASAPPTFLTHAYDDEVCPVEESTAYAEKLRQFDVPVEMHLFQSGGHGFGMGRKADGTAQWVPLFINWVKRR